MSVDIQAARALTYWAQLLRGHRDRRPEEAGVRRRPSPRRRRPSRSSPARTSGVNGLLTPMSKYYASEMSMRVANDAIAVLGGSGYMKDYASERHLRDSRITTIYEGTSQLQVVAAVAGRLVRHGRDRRQGPPRRPRDLARRDRTAGRADSRSPGRPGRGRRVRQGPGRRLQGPLRPQAGGHGHHAGRRGAVLRRRRRTARSSPSPATGWPTSCPSCG